MMNAKGKNFAIVVFI